MEEWKEINGHEGDYKISNTGKVYSYKSNKILKLIKCSSGYYRVTLCKKGTYSTCHIHRLVAEMFIGKRTSNSRSHCQVNHIDGDKLNNNIENLEYCTARENRVHANQLGLTSKKPDGAFNPSKLTVEQVKDIKKRLAANELQKDIAKIYNVRPPSIHSIKKGRTWSWVK